MKMNERYEFVVADIFEFSDGSVVFSGHAPHAPPFITTCQAHVICDGAAIAAVTIENEMIPSSRAGKGSRAVSTRSPVDVAALRKCRSLLLRLRHTSEAQQLSR